MKFCLFCILKEVIISVSSASKKKQFPGGEGGPPKGLIHGLWFLTVGSAKVEVSSLFFFDIVTTQNDIPTNVCQRWCILHPIWASVLKVDPLRGELAEGNRISVGCPMHPHK